MHCHLDLYQDPQFVISECNNRGIYVLAVTTTPKAWDGNHRIVKDSNRIRISLGLHPQIAHERSHELELFDSIIPHSKYIGEIGLDGSAELKKYSSIQLEVFRHILSSVCKNGGRIMSIHSRLSADNVLNELQTRDSGIPIMHWFTGNYEELKRAISIGCWFSVGPSMLKTKRGIDLVSRMPKEKILTETDGPFASRNGTPLYPWDVINIITILSKIWRLPEIEVQNQIDTNFKCIIFHSI